MNGTESDSQNKGQPKFINMKDSWGSLFGNVNRPFDQNQDNLTLIFISEPAIHFWGLQVKSHLQHDW